MVRKAAFLVALAALACGGDDSGDLGQVERSTGDGAIIVPPGEGKMIMVTNGLLTFKIVGEETQGEFSLIELTATPQAGPPLHRHPPKETLYILEGEFDIVQQDSTIRASAGSVVMFPSGVFHTINNVGTTAGRVLLLFEPAGFEKFFEEIGTLVTDRSSLPSLDEPLTPDQDDMDKLMAAASKYNMEILDPPTE